MSSTFVHALGRLFRCEPSRRGLPLQQVGVTTGVPHIAPDLMHCQSWQGRASKGHSFWHPAPINPVALRCPSRSQTNRRSVVPATSCHQGLRLENQVVDCVAREKRRGFTVHPCLVASKEERRQWMPALAARHMENTCLLVTGCHYYPLRGTERRCLHARHLSVPRQRVDRCAEPSREPGQKTR